MRFLASYAKTAIFPEKTSEFTAGMKFDSTA